MDNALTLSSLSAENLQRNDIQLLAKKVSYRYPSENEIPFPSYFPGLIFVRLKNGQQLTERIDIQYGNPENPMVDTDVIAKFYDNAKCVMKKTQADQLIENIMNFENIPISLLTQLLQVEA